MASEKKTVKKKKKKEASKPDPETTSESESLITAYRVMCKAIKNDFRDTSGNAIDVVAMAKKGLKRIDEYRNA